MRNLLFAATMFLVVFVASAAKSQAQSEKMIYSFAGTPDGSNPVATVVADAKTGDIYGVTINGGSQNRGAVFQLIPPATATGLWTETVIYSFGPDPDGLNPNAILEDPQTGILYGTTMFGGKNGNGTVFTLSPPSTSGAPWTESVVFSFGSQTATAPSGDFIRDNSGNFYATTIGGGVFELTPPSGGVGTWSANAISPFQSVFCDLNWPNVAGLVFDSSSGILYGTAPCGGVGVLELGTFFSLTPAASSGSWTQNNLHYFQGTNSDGAVPSGSLVDMEGVVYGTTQGGGKQNMGTVFQIIPSLTAGGSPWIQLIHSFSGGSDGELPLGGLVAVNGALFGTTSDFSTGGTGTIFGLYAGANGSWTVADLYAFKGGATDGANPVATLTPAPNGLVNGQATLYGTTFYGGANNKGTVYAANVAVPNPGAPGFSFKAICEIICFENSLRWRLPPPVWVVASDGIGIDSTVESVGEAGRVVVFTARTLNGQSKFSSLSARSLTVTFSRATDFKPGQQYRLIAKGPLVGLSPKLELLGFWKVQSH